MSVISLIQKIQQKSLREKQKIAFSISVGTSLIIFLLWVSLIHLELEGKTAPSDVEALTTPLQTISANVGSVYGEVRQQFEGFLTQEATSGLTH